MKDVMKLNLRKGTLIFFLSLVFTAFVQSEQKAVAGPFGRCGAMVRAFYLDDGFDGITCMYHFFRCECDRKEFQT